MRGRGPASEWCVCAQSSIPAPVRLIQRQRGESHLLLDGARQLLPESLAAIQQVRPEADAPSVSLCGKAWRQPARSADRAEVLAADLGIDGHARVGALQATVRC